MARQFPYNKKALITSIILSLTICLTSCNKGLPLSCYDPIYHHKHKNDPCFQDCPGVVGCDGKTYCNECGMHTNGIKKKK